MGRAGRIDRWEVARHRPNHGPGSVELAASRSPAVVHVADATGGRHASTAGTSRGDANQDRVLYRPVHDASTMPGMDFEMGHDADVLRGELRRLVGEHVPPDFLGAFTDDPADLEVAQAFCRLLADQGHLLCCALRACLDCVVMRT